MEFTQIKTFEEACTALSLDATKLPEVSLLPEKHQNALIAHYKLIIIAAALNAGWEPDWTDYSEYKYYPWFYMQNKSNTALGLSYDGCAYSGTHTTVGSRLCFKSRELAEYAGKQFEELYDQYFIIK